MALICQIASWPQKQICNLHVGKGCVNYTDLDWRYQTYTAQSDGIVRHGTSIGVIRSLPTTQVKTNAKNVPKIFATMHALDRALRLFIHVYLNAQIVVDAGDIHTWRIIVVILSTEKAQIPQLEPHATRKYDAQHGRLILNRLFPLA